MEMKRLSTPLAEKASAAADVGTITAAWLKEPEQVLSNHSLITF